MLKLGKVKLGGIPRIVVPFSSSKNLAAAKKFGFDIAELRIDQFASFETADVLREVRKFKPFPTIATIRSQKEGGAWNLSESARLQLFEAVIPKVNGVDIELSSRSILPQVVLRVKRAGKTVIISYHNFKRTPDEKKLTGILKEAKKRGADIVKIAAMTNTQADLQALAAFTLKHASQNLIIIAMGKRGAASRIFFPALGSLVTYAYLGKAMAPGQISLEKTRHYLKEFYPASF